nr:hypothetical protein [Tanacetum cinerariifolium]
MTYPVASLTLDSARSYVMQGASFTQGTIFSIPISGGISPEGLLPSILLMVIMVTVVIIVVILVVVVVAIFGVVFVVGGVSSIIKLSFMITGFLRIIVFYYLLHQPLGYGNGFLQSLRLRSINISFNTSGLGVCIPPGQGITGQGTSSKCHFVFLGTVATRKYRFSPLKPANEINCSFRTIEVERLTAYEFFIVSPFWYKSVSWSGVPIRIVSICHGSNLCF